MITFPFIILRLSLSKIKLEVIIKFKCSEVIHVNIISLHRCYCFEVSGECCRLNGTCCMSVLLEEQSALEQLSQIGS